MGQVATFSFYEEKLIPTSRKTLKQSEFEHQCLHLVAVRFESGLAMVISSMFANSAVKRVMNSVGLLTVGGLVTLFLAESLSAAILYVDLNSANSSPPYASWQTAATNIQNAVDAAVGGDTIVVSNGVFRTGGRLESGIILSRVTVDKPLAIRSVNGPQFTSVDGGAIARCVYLTNGASLTGFTLTNGAATYPGSPAPLIKTAGGGAYCETRMAWLSNCVVISNTVVMVGGGVYRGTLYSCTLVRNAAPGNAGGGAYDSTLIDCLLGENMANQAGGASLSALTNCSIVSNSARETGGGASGSTLHGCNIVSNSVMNCCGGGTSGGQLFRCNLIGNSAPGYLRQGGGAVSGNLQDCLLFGNSSYSGGGASQSVLNNCTAVGNSAQYYGGVQNSMVTNCIIFFNNAASEGNYDSYYCRLDHCCTIPAAVGIGNITASPQFLDYAHGNLRLQSNSPCINAGVNDSVVADFDLDGRPRIFSETVDMGAYEFLSSQMNEFIGWLRTYNLPADGSSDYFDTDSDGMSNWQEWICGTDPTNAASVLKLFPPSLGTPGLTIRWQSVQGKTYYVERCTNLFTPFSTIQSNIAGQVGTATYTDNVQVDAKRYFYRVGIKQ